MTRNEFIQKATIAGIEAGKHPSIAVRDAEFAARELEVGGHVFTFDFQFHVNPSPQVFPYVPCNHLPYYTEVTFNDK